MGWLNDILKQEIKDAAMPAETAAQTPPPESADFKEVLRELIREELKEALAPDTPPADDPPKQESEKPKEQEAPAKVDIAEQVKLAMADVLNKQPIKERPLEESYSRLFEG